MALYNAGYVTPGDFDRGVVPADFTTEFSCGCICLQASGNPQVLLPQNPVGFSLTYA